MVSEPDRFDHLDAAGRGIATVARRPQIVVYAVLAMAVALAWTVLIVLAIQAAALRPPGSDGPGDALLREIGPLQLPQTLVWFADLCLTPAPAGAGGLAAISALAAIWFAMSVAMMLPSAAPMIGTYCEIADTARAKAAPVVHPLVLVAGYLSVWLVASLGFAALTMAIQRFALGDGNGRAVGGIAATALAVAGLYQFSGLKEACLKKCRNPFSILFGRWSTQAPAIYRLGIEQGIWCLGCCWALMLVMFAVGVMNIFWMALIGLFSLVEKRLPTRSTTVAAGVILLVWSGGLLLRSLQ